MRRATYQGGIATLRLASGVKLVSVAHLVEAIDAGRLDCPESMALAAALQAAQDEISTMRIRRVQDAADIQKRVELSFALQNADRTRRLDDARLAIRDLCFWIEQQPNATEGLKGALGRANAWIADKERG